MDIRLSAFLSSSDLGFILSVSLNNEGVSSVLHPDSSDALANKETKFLFSIDFLEKGLYIKIPMTLLGVLSERKKIYGKK